MGIARRFYLYALSAVSLLVLSIGLFNLVDTVLTGALDALGPGIIGGGGSTGREQVSLAIALVAVGSPIFAIHWWLVGRGWAGTGPAALEDRRSSIRAFHLALVATVSLAAATFAAVRILDQFLRTVLGAGTAGDDGGLSGGLAALTVAIPVWWYHANRRQLDLRHDRLTGAAAWWTRLHRYGWMFAGLMILVGATSGIIVTIASVLIGRSEFGAGEDWWRGSIAWLISATAVGSAVFLLHRADARGAIRDAAIIGEDDRASALRATYFGAVILVALTDAGWSIVSSLGALGRHLLGVADDLSTTALLEGVIGPLLAAVPFAAAGWLHWIALRREAAGRSSLASAAAERLALHLTAAVGLAFLAVGTAAILGRLIEVALGAGLVDRYLRSEIVWFASMTGVGVVIWIPAWSAVLRRRSASPSIERVAALGRGYLLLVVGAALLAALPSAVFTIYRLIDTLLGGRGVGLGADVAIPAAAVIVSAIVAAYHGRLVASDLQYAARVETAAHGEEAAATGAVTSRALPEPGAESIASVTLTLTLRGAAGTDLESVASALREQLPDGVILDVG